MRRFESVKDEFKKFPNISEIFKILDFNIS